MIASTMISAPGNRQHHAALQGRGATQVSNYGLVVLDLYDQVDIGFSGDLECFFDSAVHRVSRDGG